MPRARCRTFYLPHLSRSQMATLAASLTERGHYAYVKGPHLVTNADESTVSFLTPVS